jgi:serine protease Do
MAAEVRPGSPAAEAGLRDEDVITAIDGQAIESADELQRAIAAREPGDTVEITFWREGARRTVEVSLGTRPDS